MPIFRTGRDLVYYAHVPKCGGSSIATYLLDRFGALAFHDDAFLLKPTEQRWTASSPQHVDAKTLERLIPLSFFDAIFTIVRHPVGRAVSTYHFQLEVERSIPEGTGFTQWLDGIEAKRAARPFLHDNHVRPMSELVPSGATVFYMEHGLNALIPWLDALTGTTAGPRAIVPENVRGAFVKTASARIKPSQTDLAMIAEIYAEDFRRFGYVPANEMPDAPPPKTSPDFMAARDRALAKATSPVGQLKRKLRRKIRRL